MFGSPDPLMGMSNFWEGDAAQMRNIKYGYIHQSNFKMDTHVQNILAQCTQRMYLIKLLKHQGMPQQQLSVITYSIIVSRILYALPAWGGFVSVELKNRINAFFKRLRRFGYTNCVICIDDLINRSDY